jgi:dCTP deaminase
MLYIIILGYERGICMSEEPLEIGTLNDLQIIEMCNSSKLIMENFSVTQVKQACYELRAGDIYYDLTEGRIRYQLKKGQEILIKPRHMTVILTCEVLDVPHDIIGRILSKGAFFSLGLTPVNTYADPGFSGNLGIVTFNNSSNYIRIPTGTGIAKIEFSRLRYPVEKPYSGQHGFQTSIWPIRDDLIASSEQLRDDERVKDEIDELVIQHGELYGRVIRRVFQYERRLLIFASAFLAVNFVLLWALQRTKLYVIVVAVAVGVLANIATTVITLLATNLRGK